MIDGEADGAGGILTDIVPTHELTRAEVAKHAWRWDQFLALKLPEPSYLIEGLLPVGGYTSWYGPPGVGKTFLALEAAMAIVSGRHFLGHFTTMGGGVLLVDQESHPTWLRSRFQGMINMHRPPDKAPLYFRVIEGIHVDSDRNDILGGFQQMRRMLEAIKPALFVMDSFTRAHLGKENESGSMADVNGAIRALMAEFDCACLVLDHARKPSMEIGDDASSDLRGSVEKMASLDAALRLTSSKHEDGRVVCTPGKTRWSSRSAAWTYEIRSDSRGVELVYRGEHDRGESDKPERLLEILKINEEPMTASDLSVVSGMSTVTVKKHVQRLIDGGLVKQQQRASEGGRPAMEYALVRRGGSLAEKVRQEALVVTE